MSAGKAKRLLKEISQIQSDSSVVVCKVTDVNDGKCNAMPLDGSAEFRDVRLNAVSSPMAGITVTPKKESIVLVSQISRVDSFVSQFSEIEKIDINIGDIKLHLNANEIVFNEGSLGLVKIDKLIEKINRLEDKLKNHQHAYVGSTADIVTTPVPADPVLTFLNTNRSELEDTKIKH